MHLSYEAAGERVHQARQVYENQYQYSDKRIPKHQLFAHAHCNLCEHGSMRSNMHDIKRRQLTRTVNVEVRVLQSFEDNSNTSTRNITQQLGVCQSVEWRIVLKQGVHPCHLQRVQLQQPNDYPKRVEFVELFMQKDVEEPNFPAFVFFTEEVSFSRECVFSVHNSHVWPYECLYGWRSHAAQHRFAINMFAGIIGDCFLRQLLPP
ncbi:uncharacterized protein TNCV_3744721 [Trichonephila clavipes]|nr:uncharacterized protein TNCV_3744721 [Trichonephila clavipes]